MTWVQSTKHKHVHVLLNDNGKIVLALRGGPEGWEIATQNMGKLHYEMAEVQTLAGAKTQAERIFRQIMATQRLFA